MRSTHELLERSMKRSECGASKEKGAKTMGGEWRSFSIHWDLARSKHAKDDNCRLLARVMTVVCFTLVSRGF